MTDGVHATAYAEWAVDYVKEDSCGPCRNNDTLDYTVMSAALRATGRPIVLTDEGSPDNTQCSLQGVCGNAKRVGHDISPQWGSMTSLVDIGAPLWPYAHNGSNPTFGGWWASSFAPRARAPRCSAA